MPGDACPGAFKRNAQTFVDGKISKVADTGHWTLDTGHWTLDMRSYGAERDAIMQPKIPKLEPQVL
jgi:hypothetical protein